MKKILIISNSYPNFGGQSTTAYNLLKLLKRNDLHAELVYINYAKQSEADPEKTGASHKIALRQSFAYRMYHWYKQRFNIGPDSLSYKLVSGVKNIYFFLLVMPRLYSFMFSKKMKPHLVITNIPVYYSILRHIFDPARMLVIVGSSSEMYELSKKNIDAQMVLSDPAAAHKMLGNYSSANYSKTNVVFNSRLTQQIYDALNIRTATSSVQYFNLAPISTRSAGVTKKYDLAFIASDFQRSIKNVPLAKSIFKHFGELPKIAIGKGSAALHSIQNTETADLLTQQEIAGVLAATRLLIITSYFDSSPGVLSEAILNGCNVLISKNVGWHDQLDKSCVVENYHDLDEWASKASYLLNHKVDYAQFEAIMANAEQQICTVVNELTSG